MALPGSGTMAGIGQPSGSSASGSARAPAAGLPLRSAQRVSWKPSPSGRRCPPSASRRCRDGQQAAGFERVLDADVVPHALRKVRVEVAVEDRVARGLVAVADAAVVYLVGVARARHDFLGVQVVGVVVVRVEQPLVVVQVEDVLLERTDVDVADLDEVTGVGVVHVGRVFLVQRVVARDRRVGTDRRSPPLDRDVDRRTDASRPDVRMSVGSHCSMPVLAGKLTSMAGSPTVCEARKNSS